MQVRLVAGAVVCSSVAACASSSVPSPSAPAANTAAITVASVVGTVDKVPVGAVYHFSLRLKETGGHSGATISSVLFTMPTGVAAFTATYTPATAQRVPAGGSLDLGPISTPIRLARPPRLPLKPSSPSGSWTTEVTKEVRPERAASRGRLPIQ
jgi:hypothetical protein